MDLHALVSRSWNDTPISRRTSDGYVNATAMCKANAKRWKDYHESDRCQTYLDALGSVAGNSGHALIESAKYTYASGLLDILVAILGRAFIKYSV